MAALSSLRARFLIRQATRTQNLAFVVVLASHVCSLLETKEDSRTLQVDCERLDKAFSSLWYGDKEEPAAESQNLHPKKAHAEAEAEAEAASNSTQNDSSREELQESLSMCKRISGGDSAEKTPSPGACDVEDAVTKTEAVEAYQVEAAVVALEAEDAERQEEARQLSLRHVTPNSYQPQERRMARTGSSVADLIRFHNAEVARSKAPARSMSLPTKHCVLSSYEN